MLPILYCILTDTLVNFYLLLILKVVCKDKLSYSKKTNTFGNELDVDVTKQQLLNVTIITYSYT